MNEDAKKFQKEFNDFKYSLEKILVESFTYMPIFSLVILDGFDDSKEAAFFSNVGDGDICGFLRNCADAIDRNRMEKIQEQGL